MSSHDLAANGGVNPEIASLIESFHAIGQRLEDLTEGEVDTVTDRSGRTLLLRRSQEHARFSEALKQAAILDALPAHIAVLDAQGCIVSVNEAWRRFATENALETPRYAVGVNYLTVCDEAFGCDSVEGHKVAIGIRAVLEDDLRSFSIEYPCHALSEQRWFLLTVTPLAGPRQLGAVVMHLNITENKRAKQALRESERRFSDMLGSVQLAAVMLDREARITYCNDYLLRLTGWQRADVMGQDWFDTFMPPELGDMKPVFTSLLANLPEAWHREQELYTRSRERRLVRWNNSVLRSVAGDVIGVASIGEDVTEHKAAEVRIKRLNRVHMMLSGINTLIVRVRDRDELFREACRLAVELGGFKMAWVGVTDPHTLDGKVIASCCDEETDMDSIQLTARIDAPSSRQPASRALQTMQPVICNDVDADPAMSPFLFEHQRHGHQSVGYFPLTLNGKSTAVMALFSAEIGVFDAQETQLLLELVGDIAFALDHIEKLERLEYLAYYDVLTGLANCTLFLDRVTQHIGATVSGNHQTALLLFDLERFKNINDSLGQTAGDALLCQVAEWLTRNLGDADLVARIGADRFAVVWPHVMRGIDVRPLLEQMLVGFLNHPFRLNEAIFRIAVKVGIALFPHDGTTADNLYKNAEAALKKAKSSGDRFLFYTPQMTASVASKLTLENHLRQALEKEEFVLHYQPKVNLLTGSVTSAEALIRWNDPRTGLVPPAHFIPILEETGLIYDVGRWALHKAVEDYLRWCRSGLAAVRVAVNVSPLQLRNRDFIAEIESTISVDPQAAAGLELEITESLVMEDVLHSISSLRAIRSMGVRIAIDDFGTGFSSLSYLAKLPVDTLKIDRSFVVEMPMGPDGLALVDTIITLAHSLKLRVVAEGVETQEQSELLRTMGCDEMQGYLFSRPMPCEEFESRYLGT